MQVANFALCSYRGNPVDLEFSYRVAIEEGCLPFLEHMWIPNHDVTCV